MPTPRAALAACIDHTLLAPTATRAEVLATTDEARDLGCATVCVSPVHLPLLGPDGAAVGVPVCTVVGFPSGAHAAAAKAHEAAVAVAAGAAEVDVVMALGLAKAGAWADVEAELVSVRAAVPSPLVLKVIIEAAALTDDEVVAACRAAEAAGADLVKTSTGFHPAGGASLHAVALMAATVGGRLGVKASGGIRTTEAALAMLEAGATRLGASATRAILDGL